ncbi:chemotaxis protein CheW [Terrihabitans soli]|uniref:Chemotaxis protein CheW n=1 Tax=Terrihabitans soli TaxID=708113 RepID=A0A6S6QXI4_9HYPH|nr:chemotaxis protein CheW [Terrihabitans soli]BCJ92245.1 chemotaxis protein CheW [Terrihabitans soli]
MTVDTIATRRFERAWPSAAAADARNPDDPWLVYRAGGQLHALPISCIVEIMRPQPIVPVEGAPDYILGLSIIRGQPVPIVDVGRLIGGKASMCSRIVTVRLGARTVGLCADAVLGKQQIGRATLARLPPLLSRVATTAIDEVGTLDREFLFVLQGGCLIPEDILDCLEAAGTAR